MTRVSVFVATGMFALLTLASVSPALGQNADEATVSDAAPGDPGEGSAASQVDPDDPPGAGGGHAAHNLRNYLHHLPETDTWSLELPLH